MKENKISIWKAFKKKSIIYFAKVIIKKHNPEIIGVLDYEDNSSEFAISYIFDDLFNTRHWQSEEKDIELNLAFSIFGKAFERKNSSIFGVTFLFLKEFFSKKHPQILILPYKTQKLGDIDLLLGIAKPNVVVIMSTTNKYCKFLGSEKDFLEEKIKFVMSINLRKTKKNHIAILNEDDNLTQKIKKQLNCSIYTYSIKKKSSFYATGIHLSVHEGVLHGISFKVNYNGNSVPIRLTNIITPYDVHSILAVIALASAYKINMVDIAQKLKTYMPPAGRMRYLEGKNSSKIIDDTYNSSLNSTYKALETLVSIESNRKILVLGELSQACNFKKQNYEDIVKKIVSKKIDFVILVGSKFNLTMDYLLKNSFVLDDNLFFCSSSLEAGEILVKRIKRGDLILVKGSSEMHMEKVVEKIIK